MRALWEKANRAEEVKYMAYKASRNRFNVIITGESGTGKSMLAKEIHCFSNPNSPFIEGKLQCHCADAFRK